MEQSLNEILEELAVVVNKLNELINSQEVSRDHNLKDTLKDISGQINSQIARIQIAKIESIPTKDS